MMQRALQASIAITREGPPLDKYNLWVGGVTTKWHALDWGNSLGTHPLSGGENAGVHENGWIGTWTAHCMRAGIVILVRFVAAAMVI